MSIGRQRTEGIKQFIVKIKRKVCFENKIKSANKIAKEEGFSETLAVRPAIHEHLSLNMKKKIRESREAENEDFGTQAVHTFPYKFMIWAGITFNEVTTVLILPRKKPFHETFYI